MNSEYIIPDGTIRITRIPLPFDRVRIEYQLLRMTEESWVEATPREVKYIAINHYVTGLKEFTPVVAIGPYRFRFVCHREWMGDALYVPDLPFSRLRVWTYKATRWLDDVYRRLIITAYIWGLANWNTSVTPSWRDLKIVGCIKKKIGEK